MQIPSRLSRVNSSLHPQHGFSLIEVAVVLLIISILVTAIAIPLSTQLDSQRFQETQRQLEVAKEAIYGFALANGRLPCPALVAGATAVEAPVGGVCTNQAGFLPAVTLGLSGNTAGGYLADSWDDGTAIHRIRYAVSNANTSALTTSNGVQTATMSAVAGVAHLIVCSTGLTVAPSATVCDEGSTLLTDKAPFVIYSLGKNTSTASNDSLSNQNAVGNTDTVFTAGTQNAAFDDVVTWGSLNILFARMVQAGKLP